MEKSRAPLNGHLYVGVEGVAFLGRGLHAEPHRHFTASVTLSLDHPVRVRAGSDDTWHSVHGMAAPSNVPQELESSDASVLNLQVDPETETYARLQEKLWARGESVYFQAEELAPLRTELRKLAAEPSVRGNALWDAAIDALGAPARGPRRFDVRIARVLEILKASMADTPSTRALGEQVGLSEGRLIHLFSEQVGVPLRRYVLWLRVRHVVFCLAMKQSLTDAAHEAGFADSAHLTRVFRSMFGLAPSQMLRNDQVAISLELPALPLTGPHAVQDQERLVRLLASFNTDQWRSR
jgi:AraC-like DNA-binding protein